MKKALPIGVENFEDMLKSGYYYVDKTMFIKELLDLKGKVNGRGAYLKKDLQVILKAQKSKALNRHLEVEVPESIYKELESLLGL